jgi:NAD(P)-dependent dehydrogenase (short-subunit alcohol dehydrogenase family)
VADGRGARTSLAPRHATPGRPVGQWTADGPSTCTPRPGDRRGGVDSRGGGVAQSVRAAGLYPAGSRFESWLPYHPPSRTTIDERSPTPGLDDGWRARVAIVSGAAGGIGRATVDRLLADGLAVGAIDLDADALRRLTEAAGHDARLTTAVADVADAEAIHRAVADIAAALGPVDAVVSNAGIGGRGSFLDMDPAAWQRLQDVHVGGAVHLTRAVLPGMLGRGGGRIVTILTDGLWHGRTTVGYTAAKGALLGFTRALAVEVAPRGVRVNAVAPGPVATAMLLDDDPAAVEAERRTVPTGRFLPPASVAASIAFLVGPGGDDYVGQVLAPNGGTVLAG